MKVASVIALLVVAGCTPPSRLVRPVEHPNYGDDPLRLVLTDPSDSRPVAVSAGSATVWIGRDGGGTGHPAYVLASSGEPLISVENPFAFKILMDGQVVPFQPGPGYSQTLDLRNGAVETRWSGQDFSVTTVCRSLERGPSVELSVEVRSTQPIQIEWPKSRPPELNRLR